MLRLVPLGGLGEVGMNCMAVEHGDDLVLIDCGVLFPFRELGVDIIHPDFSWVRERRERLRAVVLTHGHEDHIGGLPYLLRDAPVPIYGPPYALGLVRERLRGAEISEPEMIATRPRERFDIGSLGFEPVRVTHSIPDATALAVHTSIGTVVHSGDFNIDEHPPYGDHFDETRMRELGDQGIRLLLSDSTNVTLAGDSGLERDVRDTLGQLIEASPRRVVVSLFASNVYRAASVIDIARRMKRKVCLLGRSLYTHLHVAADLGLIDDPSPLLLPSERARHVPPRELMVLATGTQGEAPAALPRLARGDHPDLELELGDRVILSSRIIPGHEDTVYAMIDRLERRGVEVYHRGIEPGVHVSGHAGRTEQRHLLELLRPRGFVPIHGTYHHLRRHAALAHDAGVAQIRVAENGAVVEVDTDSIEISGQAPTGRVHVDGGVEVPDTVLRDRALLSEVGFAVAVVHVDGSGRCTGEPDVLTRGVLEEDTEPGLMKEARVFVAEALRARSGPPRVGVDEERIRDEARRALRRFMHRRLARKPLAYAVVVRVS